MKKVIGIGWVMAVVIMACCVASRAWTDGGYFSKRSVAISADQRAIIIKNGDEISMTFFTGYTGEGEDFGWIIPTPVPPAVEDVSEAGEQGEATFQALDELTSPNFTVASGGRGCFPSGTEVLTAEGPRAIESVEAGSKVQACDLATGRWSLAKVLQRVSLAYEGDTVTMRLGPVAVRSTGNHPFFVIRGDRLAARSLPRDVPPEEQGISERGRWVEARELKVGDVLMASGSKGMIITGISSRQEKLEVYNLVVEGFHTYAVDRSGILVHNKGKGEAGAPPKAAVTVYGRVTLEHYEISILRATGSAALMDWLNRSEYQVNPEAGEILGSYILRNWAFVAVRLNPSEKRHYQNEFLPPLTIRYQHGEIVFPLRISSVSTTQTAKITLYVIAESTVTSVNFPTEALIYETSLSRFVDPEKYVESCIRSTQGSEQRALVRLWSGRLGSGAPRRELERLMNRPFLSGTVPCLTRLEARMDPAAMSDDIRIVLDPEPVEFRVEIRSLAGHPQSWLRSIAVDASGRVFACGYVYSTGTYEFQEGVTATGTSTDYNAILVKYDPSGDTLWVRTPIANGSSEFHSVAVDAGGNVYAGGIISGTIGSYDFGEGVAATWTSGSRAAILVKYDSSGKALWVRTASADAYASFGSVAVDAEGNVYAAGSIGGSGGVDFGGGVTATGSVVLVKYDASGRALWARAASKLSYFNSVAVDAEGNVAVTGYIYGAKAADFGGGVTATWTSVYRQNGILVKYDPLGEALWARAAGGNAWCAFPSVAMDAGGNVLAIGRINGGGTADFGGGVTATGPVVLVKYHASGKALWARAAGSDAGSMLTSVEVDAGGNVYSGGSIGYSGGADFGGGVTATRRGILLKYSPSGMALWARAASGTVNTNYSSVAVDAVGNVYVAVSSSSGGVDFGGGVMSRRTFSEQSGIIVKYDAAGRPQWARAIIASLD